MNIFSLVNKFKELCDFFLKNVYKVVREEIEL